eukprot:CAMPEP_0179010048 /NCGR_PEP_ID=MMETSP0795-20121207/16593_1 /TAXON_ID=88552 /ORGANISM="Amoebophrya sp., Strain Ameob2" /LENGTH=96 /DNA_ID=CAMNT_0020705277 /DNA_START=322 /DNA_END=613 /DNA_ORIENTATION=+
MTSADRHAEDSQGARHTDDHAGSACLFYRGVGGGRSGRIGRRRRSRGRSRAHVFEDPDPAKMKHGHVGLTYEHQSVDPSADIDHGSDLRGADAAQF